jgi:monoterpene epsilon-lactone hydrolase
LESFVSWIVAVAVLVAILWGITRFYLRGEDLRRYDEVKSVHLTDSPIEVPAPSDEHFETIELVRELGVSDVQQPRAARVRLMREKFDALSDGLDLGAEITAVDVAGIAGEWVCAPGVGSDRRLLYLHGGAFALGSAKSHRAVTAKFSRIAGAAVLAVDYRLMPENRRLDGLVDCQSAYRWIVDNGPGGPESVATLFIAGDSAGGNLTLAVIAWARDAGLRPVEAAVALSPATDSTLSSPSIVENMDSDHMLGPGFRPLTRMPRGLVLWVAWIMNRVRPCDPRVSPAHGNLANLPPTLVHASEAEMLLDDARRYVAKAQAAGSPATLATWHHVLHVWHMFEQNLPEAKAAFAHIETFLEEVAPSKL